jgi:polysaccharide chain length determinant protein (PEP-CTERM system associated)
LIIPFLVTLLGGLTYTLIIPKIYEAETLILVQRQKVPEDFVRAIVSSDLEDRLRTITQQVTSRTNLEGIIKEYGLYDDAEKDLLLEDKVILFRENIRIDISDKSRKRGGETAAFTISFRGQDPDKVTRITNALASNFITENLKIRETQAIGTSAFLTDELESVKRRLAEKEGQLKQYREKYMGGLPEQLETNLSILERLQAQLDQYNQNLRDAENRRIITQKEVSSAQKEAKDATAPTAISSGSEPRDLLSLKSELAALQAKYTEKHPDVIRLKSMIANFESSDSLIDASERDTAEKPAVNSKEAQMLLRQLTDIELEIKGTRAEIAKLQSQIKWYQQKVEETPKREQELLTLNRDYNNLRALYDSLLNRKLEAEISVSMEKKQKGEQFRVIDPAKAPKRPVEPDVHRIVLLTLLLALSLGCGLAYSVEMMDTSYKVPDDLEKDLQVPVLVSMPIRYTDNELKKRKRRAILAYASAAASFVITACLIVVTVKGLDTTLAFVKGLLK